MLVLCLAIVVFAGVYWWNPAGPRYYPIEGVWRMDRIDGVPSMAWYGRCLYANAACAAMLLLGRFTLGARTRENARPLPRAAVAAISILAMGSLVLAAFGIACAELAHAAGH